MNSGKFQDIEESITQWLERWGIRPIPFSTLIIAFTHPSFKGIESDAEDYERLEYLGDSVLDLVIAEELFRNSQSDEGELTESRKELVKNRSLAKMFDKLDMSNLIRTANVYHLSMKDKANFIEALFGVIHLEHRYEYCIDIWRKFYSIMVTKEKKNTNPKPNDIQIQNELLESYKKEMKLNNAKSLLQEFCQKNKFDIPIYKIVNKFGKDHEPIFIVDIEIRIFDGNSWIFIKENGYGISKKQAELNAAEKLCDRLGLDYIHS